MDPINIIKHDIIKQSNIKITIIILFICIVIIGLIFFTNKKQPLKHKINILMSDKKKIIRGLESAGIIIYNNDNFENNSNNVIFDSIDKINNHFEDFIDYYMPLIESKLTNDIFKQFNINTTLQNEINNKNLNIIDLFSEPYGFINQSLLLSYSIKNNTFLILLGLSSIVLMKLKYNILNNYKLVYYNDYNEYTMDFNIYFIPLNYTNNIKNLNNNKNILDMNETNITGNEIFKISLFNHLDKLLMVQINLYKKSDISFENRFHQIIPPLYEDDKILFVNELYNNRHSILINIRLYLVSLFAYINNPSNIININSNEEVKSTELSKYIIDRLYNPIYYTKSFYNFLTVNILTDNLNEQGKFGLLLASTSTIASNILKIELPSTQVSVTLPSTLTTPSITTTINIPTTTETTTTTTTTLEIGRAHV